MERIVFVYSKDAKSGCKEYGSLFVLPVNF